MVMNVPQAGEQTARAVGRILRILLGLALTWMTYRVMRSEDPSFNARVVGLFAGLTVFYAFLHLAITQYAAGLNRWLGAVLAVAPVVLVFLLGGPLGRVGSVAFIGVSLLLQGIRGDGGCEVMSIPGLIFSRRTHLVCIFFSPIDWMENQVAQAMRR